MFASKLNKVLLIAIPTAAGALVGRQIFAECKESSDTVTIKRQKREFGKYLGCFEDREENRNFKGYIQKSHKNTIEGCCATCRDGGFVYAATAGIWCVCGNKYPDAKVNPKISEDRCCDTCSGNPKQKCGGNYVFSVFETGNERKSRNFRPKVDWVLIYDISRIHIQQRWQTSGREFHSCQPLWLLGTFQAKGKWTWMARLKLNLINAEKVEEIYFIRDTIMIFSFSSFPFCYKFPT